MDLTDAYEIGAHTPNMDAYRAAWPVDAAAFRENTHGRLDLVYGPDDRQRFDLFEPQTAPLGLAVFVHGGYWRITSKDLWSHLAAGAVARGWAVAVPSYRLAPRVRISEITQDVATAITAAADLVQGPIVISGHSAGGHLAARMLCRGVLPEQVAKRVRHGAPISALSDLRPLMHTAMNSDLQIDPNEAMAESPALISDRIDADCTVWVGAEERPALLDQSRWLAEAWDADLRIAPGRHHFDVIADLTDPDSPLVRNMLGVG